MGKSKLGSRGLRGKKEMKKKTWKLETKSRAGDSGLEWQGEGEKWGWHSRSGSLWKARASVQSPLLPSATHFTSGDKNRYKTVKARWGKPFKKGGEVMQGVRRGQWWGERIRIRSERIRRGFSDSSGAAEDKTCRLFLPLQTFCLATSPNVVINTSYFLLSAF